MIPVGLLFAWLGALESTTSLHLVLAAVVTTGYLAAECFGDHAALDDVSPLWRLSYFIARMSVFQAACFLACLVSFAWLPPPNLPPQPPPSSHPIDHLGHFIDSLAIAVPYAAGAAVMAAIAWIANLLAAVKIRRARWLLIVTTLPGALSVLLILYLLIAWIFTEDI